MLSRTGLRAIRFGRAVAAPLSSFPEGGDGFPSQPHREIPHGPGRTKDGEFEIELSQKKRLRVRTFKDTPLVDIREFFETPDGLILPTKKGISLTRDQWNRVAEYVNEIDQEMDVLASQVEEHGFDRE